MNAELVSKIKKDEIKQERASTKKNGTKKNKKKKKQVKEEQMKKTSKIESYPEQGKLWHCSRISSAALL